MKTIKYLIIVFLMGLFSCESLLEENYLTGVYTESFYTTKDGLETLINSCYATSKIWFAKEEGYDFSEAGTDIYDYGQQHPQQSQYTYTTEFNSTNSRLVVLWIEFYKGINACNEAIDVLSDPNRTPFDAAKTKIRLAEVRFLRALYNWLVVETWGGVQLRTKPVKGVIKTAEKSSVADFYKLIFEDLDFAVENLGDNVNTSSSDYGRVNKLAALAFRARIRLTWACHIRNGNFENIYNNNADELFQGAAADADAVIKSGKFELYDKYEDVWNINNNSNNKENIWAINYSLNKYAEIGVDPQEYRPYQKKGDKVWDPREGGHHGHLMFGMQYDVLSGMTRDIENGRPFRRYAPTKYLIDVFNENVDERFFGTFKTTWFVNNPTDLYHVMTKIVKDKKSGDTDTTIFKVEYTTFAENEYIDRDSAIIYIYKDGKPNDTIMTPGSLYLEKDIKNKTIKPKLLKSLKMGDTAIHLLKNTLPNNILYRNVKANYIWNKIYGYWTIDYKRMFNDDGTINEVGTFNRNLFFELHKFYDNTRAAATDEGSQRGKRDAYVLRISEMYIIAAEAYFYLNEKNKAYTDYLIPLANKRSYNGNGAAMLASYGINNGDNLTISFFLDERAREFAGEQLRWFDLKRLSKTDMINRIKQYAGNTAARTNFDEHFILRPIPQVQIDAITNKDEFLQNPGY
jgi:hypothetical protein